MLSGSVVVDAPQIALMRWWHAEPVAAIERAVFPAPWSIEQFFAELAQVPGSRHYLVAAADGEVIGYGGLRVVGADSDIQTIAIAPSHRGLGVGRRLLDDLLQEARRRVCTQVFLEVRADDDLAVGMYERRGFVTTHVREAYYGTTDALAMRLVIAGA